MRRLNEFRSEWIKRFVDLRKVKNTFQKVMGKFGYRRPKIDQDASDDEIDYRIEIPSKNNVAVNPRFVKNYDDECAFAISMDNKGNTIDFGEVELDEEDPRDNQKIVDYYFNKIMRLIDSSFLQRVMEDYSEGEVINIYEINVEDYENDVENE